MKTKTEDDPNVKPRGWRSRKLTMEEAELLRERWAATFVEERRVERVPVYGRAGKIRCWEEREVRVRRKKPGAPLLKEIARAFGIDASTASNVIADRTYGGLW